MIGQCPPLLAARSLADCFYLVARLPAPAVRSFRLPPQPFASLPFRTPPPSETSSTSPSFAGVLRPVYRERNGKILKKTVQKKMN